MAGNEACVMRCALLGEPRVDAESLENGKEVRNAIGAEVTIQTKEECLCWIQCLAQGTDRLDENERETG